MKNFFETRVWFFGREDWDRSYVRSDYHIPPYPQFRRLLPSDFDIACLTQAVTSEEISLILQYSGTAWGNTETMSDHLHFVYPDGWSFDQYMQTLTTEDINTIRSDQERLKRLHNGNFHSMWDTILNGCSI